jgi:hypothetical protein
MVVKPGSYVKVVTYVNMFKLRVELVGRVSRLSEKLGVQFSEVIWANPEAVTTFNKHGLHWKMMYSSGTWVKYVEMKQLQEEEALGYLL